MTYVTSTLPSSNVVAAAGVVPSAPMSYDQTINTWIQAGGNPQSAAMAAAVADAESGLNPNQMNVDAQGNPHVGLWQIQQNGNPPGHPDPVTNARAAVQLSNNGTNWQNWCSTWSDNACGKQGGTYLGSGSNALSALGMFLGSSYSVVGAQPASNGTSASAATTPTGSTATTSPTTSSSGGTNWLLVILIGAGAALAFYTYQRHKAGATGTEVTAGGGVQQTGKTVTIPAHTRTLPSPDTTGPYRPRNPQA